MSRTSAQHARTRSLSATALSAAVLAVLVSAAGPAAAGEDDPAGGVVEVTPRKARAGEWVDLRVDFCADGERALAASDAFHRDVELEPAADGELLGEARIRRDAEPGRYEITADCQAGTDAAVGEGVVTVIGRAGDGDERQPPEEDRPSERPPEEDRAHEQPRPRESEAEAEAEAEAAPDRHHEQHDGQHDGQHDDQHHGQHPPASPVAPVRAGGGGTYDGQDGAGGLGATGTTGLSLAGGAVVLGTVAYAVRRRRADRTANGR